MKGQPCRLCYGLGMRYVATHADGLTLSRCPCVAFVPIARVRVLAQTDNGARWRTLRPADLPVDAQELDAATGGSST